MNIRGSLNLGLSRPPLKAAFPDTVPVSPPFFLCRKNLILSEWLDPGRVKAVLVRLKFLRIEIRSELVLSQFFKYLNILEMLLKSFRGRLSFLFVFLSPRGSKSAAGENIACSARPRFLTYLKYGRYRPREAGLISRGASDPRYLVTSRKN